MRQLVGGEPWQGSALILRWTAARLPEAERNFRSIAGYRALSELDTALRAHDAEIDRGLIIANRALHQRKLASDTNI